MDLTSALNMVGPGTANRRRLVGIADLVLSADHAGLIINPAGPRAGVPREDIEKIVNGGFK